MKFRALCVLLPNGFNSYPTIKTMLGNITRTINSRFTQHSKRLLLSLKVKYKMASAENQTDSSSRNMTTNSSTFKPVTHVIFDMDGLLLDTEVIYERIISDIVESFGKKYTSETRLKVLGTTEQSTAQIVIEDSPLPITLDEFIKVFREKQMNTLGKAPLMAGAERLILHLHKNNVPIAVATSSGSDSVRVKTEKHQMLFSLFHHIVMGSSDPDVKHGKPAPDIFQICAQRFPDKPSYDKCLVFEDAPNGVTGAVDAGMQVVMVPDPLLPTERTKHATIVLKSLLDFQPEEFGLPSF